MEDIRFDGDGQLLSGSFMDYAMPRAENFGPFHIESNPVPTKTNPLGVKGAGEAGCGGALPAGGHPPGGGLSPPRHPPVGMPGAPPRLDPESGGVGKRGE